MTRKADKGRSTNGHAHYRLHQWVARTEAWKELTGDQKAIYLGIAIRYNGKNNGKIPFSIREAAAYARVGKTMAAQHLRRLQELGFIVAEQDGAFDWKASGKSSRWRLTEFGNDVRVGAPSHEFAEWLPGMSFLPPHKQNAVRSQVHPVPEAGHPVPEAGHFRK